MANSRFFKDFVFGISFILFFNNCVITSTWKIIDQNIQNAVVQVFCQKVEFNWLQPYKSPTQKQGSGTGFFINRDGDLLTNYHVVEQAKSVYINMPAIGQQPLDVEIVGVCPDQDIALLRLTEQSYNKIVDELAVIPYLTLGDSDNIYRAEPVIALGYPMGERYLKSTTGVIAGRDYLSSRLFSAGNSYIHITAPINPGNSGGPLLNHSGEVLGINTMGRPFAEGMNYIIPINEVKINLEKLYKVKLYNKPLIGIYYNHVTDEHARLFKSPVPGGIYITDVAKGSIAEKAGIKKGDMLYAIKWQDMIYDIDSHGDVKVDWRPGEKVCIGELVSRWDLEDDITFIVYRNGERLDLDCKYILDNKYAIRYVYPEYESQEIDYEIFAGAVFMQLRLNHFEYLLKNYSSTDALYNNYLFKYVSNINNRDKNLVIITHIFPGSIMTKDLYFLYPGTVIDTINSIKVRTLNDLRKALLDCAKSDDLCITTKDGFATAISLDRVLKEESRLAKDYVYNISDTVKKLVELRKDNLKK